MQSHQTSPPVAISPAGSTLLLPRDVAEMLRSSTSTLAKMRMTGEGPAFVKVGGRVLYRAEDITAYIDRQRRTSTLDDKVKQMAELPTEGRPRAA